jgi:hypothetical protein
MKALGSITFAIASAVGACVAAASVASLVMAEPEPHSLATLTAPELWTAKPIRVDRATQRYERLAPVFSTYVTEASTIVPLKKGSVSTPATATHDQDALSAQHLEWCAHRYRSFDPTTNTYRSFGGDIKRCVSPFGQTAASDGRTVETSARAPGAAWCASQYKSYRPEDNTYQPYGKPRRTCVPPDAVLASNE